MRREPWYDSDNPSQVARGAGWRIGFIILIIIAFVGAISGGIWIFKVATSEVKGAGDRTLITNDLGRNQVNSQEWFEGQYGQIKSADRKLDEAFRLTKAQPADEFHQENYTGLKNFCMDIVEQYNAEANKVSRGKWMSPTLPAQIDQADPATDCKENVQ